MPYGDGTTALHGCTTAFCEKNGAKLPGEGLKTTYLHSSPVWFNRWWHLPVYFSLNRFSMSIRWCKILIISTVSIFWSIL